MSDKIQELKMNELKDMFFYTFGIVPLQNYGVVGDGMTDNRLKIQQAIYDAIEVKAKYIFVPKGNYYYSQELFRADEVAWLGNSVDAHIKDIEIKQFPSFDNVVNITDAYSENKQDTYSATYINNEIDKKVDKIDGKDLSTNDFTDEYKEKIDNKVDMVEGKSLSSNDFTDEYKQILDNPINVKNEYSESTNDTYSSDYINKKIDEKVDKVEGKDLSTNDFTDEYKQKVDNANTYSTEEIRIGTWIDNKPIYRKTFTSIYVSANSTDYNIDISDLNIDNVISLSGTAEFIQNGSTQWRALPHVYDRIETTAIFIDSNLLYVRSYGFTVGQCYITLEYTKTTD